MLTVARLASHWPAGAQKHTPALHPLLCLYTPRHAMCTSHIAPPPSHMATPNPCASRSQARQRPGA